MIDAKTIAGFAFSLLGIALREICQALKCVCVGVGGIVLFFVWVSWRYGIEDIREPVTADSMWYAIHMLLVFGASFGLTGYFFTLADRIETFHAERRRTKSAAGVLRHET